LTLLEQEQLTPSRESGKTSNKRRNLIAILKASELKFRVGLGPLNKGHNVQKGLLDKQALKKLSLAFWFSSIEQILVEINLKIGAVKNFCEHLIVRLVWNEKEEKFSFDWLKVSLK
jgi:hypothetical protein